VNGTGLPTRPYLKPWYRLAEDGDRLVFEYGQSLVVLEGRAVKRLVPALLPLLDGTRRRDEIVAVLGQEVAPAVDHALRLLAERRLLTDGPPLEDTAAEAASCALFVAATAHAGIAPAAAAKALVDSSVAVVGESPAGEELARLLRRSGVGSIERRSWDEGPAGPLAVVAPTARELPRLESWNRAALAAGSPWLQLLPHDGRYASVGPLFVPGETCCHRCLGLRRSSNLDFPAEFWTVEQTPAARPSPPSLAAVSAGLTATLALRWLAYADPLVPGRLFALELSPTPAVTAHLVYKVPRCPDCSGLDGCAAPLPWYKEESDACR
jgi:bacteriocin biosynthesis cyclodehydratase domain-containing protein